MDWQKLGTFLTIWAALLTFSLTACGDLYNTVDQDAVENGEKKMFLSCAPDNINIDGGGSVTIVVQVLYDNDSPVAQASVLVTSTLGTVAASDVTTDDDGVGATTLTPGDETGTAVVVATHSTLQARCEVSFYETGDNAGG